MTASECPYCFDRVKAGDAATCPWCGAAYHRDCWNETEDCTRCGSSRSRDRLEIDIEPDTPKAPRRTRQPIREIPHRQARTTENLCIECGRPAPPGEVHCTQCGDGEHKESFADRSRKALVIAAYLLLCIATAALLVPVIEAVLSAR